MFSLSSAARLVSSIGFHKLGLWNMLFGILAGIVSLICLYFISITSYFLGFT
jgi:hypothetical protein